MMYKKYTAVVLAVLVLAAEANPSAKLLAPPLMEAQYVLTPPIKWCTVPYHDLTGIGTVKEMYSRTFLTLLIVIVTKREKWGDLGVTANVNDYVDETISMLVPLIQRFGLDPMELPEVIEGFEVRYLLVTYSAWLKIHDGYMTGLVNVARSGDQKVNYFAKMLRLRIELQFNNLEFVYKFLVKVMRIGPTGGIRGSLDRFKVVTDILIDFNNDEIHLQQFSLTDIGRLSVRLTGSLLAWLVNPVITVFVRIFDTIIMKVVEINIRNAIHFGIAFFNSNLKTVIDFLESFN